MSRRDVTKSPMSVNVVVVGLGYWGPNLARAVSSVRGGRLYGICDSSPERLKRFGSMYPSSVAFSSLDLVLADPEVNAVVVATPVDTHYELAAQALKAGRHVLVEKPLARSSEECEALIALAAANHLVLMVGHVFLYNMAVRKVREYVQAGELGDVYYAYSQRLNLGQVRRDVNALWNFAPHDFSILSYWLGAEPERVTTRGYAYVQPGIEDVVFVTADFPGGIGAHIHISWLDPQKVRLMTLVGTRKMMVYDDTQPDARVTIYDKGVTKVAGPGSQALGSLGRYETFGEFQLLHRAGDVLIPKIDFVEPLQVECQHFVDCIRDGTTPLTDGASGLAVVRALEAAQQSMDRKVEGEPVGSLPLGPTSRSTRSS
jgi:predicted dehydrogenase